MAVCTFLPLMLVGFPMTFCPLSTLPVSCLQKDLRLSSVDHDERPLNTNTERVYIHLYSTVPQAHVAQRSAEVSSLLYVKDESPPDTLLSEDALLILFGFYCLMPNGSPHCCRQKGLEQWPFTAKQDLFFSLSSFLLWLSEKEKNAQKLKYFIISQEKKKKLFIEKQPQCTAHIQGRAFFECLFFSFLQNIPRINHEWCVR